MGRLVEIARFYDPEEMICAQSYLRALGVETFAENESLLNVAPYLRMAVGGYALHAPASLAEDAKSALAAAQAVDITEPSAAEGFPPAQKLDLDAGRRHVRRAVPSAVSLARDARHASLIGDCVDRHVGMDVGAIGAPLALQRSIAVVAARHARSIGFLGASHDFRQPFLRRPRANACGSCGGLRRLPARHHRHHPLSTNRRQPGILMKVHSGHPPRRFEAW
jgi:hypothetical protein